MRSLANDGRSFLFLQGPLSPLYSRLGDTLRSRGHDVLRVNLCAGDRLHWGKRNAVSYRGTLDRWGAFADRLMAECRITDVVLHGDRRPYHRIAAERARARGLQVIATELGYLRPDWLTIEQNATAAGSHFPSDPGEIRRIAETSPAVDTATRYPTEFRKVAVPDVTYNLLNTFLWFLYPHYRRHTLYFPPLEYLQWLGRLATARRRRMAADRIIAAGNGAPYFLFALQLEGDYQIREHSPFDSLADALALVIASFARHAAPESRLLVKAHPLDNGLHRWDRCIAALASEHGVGTRVGFLDGGDLAPLLPRAEGMVTVNSNAGIEALAAGRAVKVLAPAIYDVAGLTHGNGLDSFWQSPERPDPVLVGDFVRALAATVQVRGSIYNDDGLDAAVAGMAARILENRLNEPGGFVAVPPRAPALGRAQTRPMPPAAGGDILTGRAAAARTT